MLRRVDRWLLTRLPSALLVALAVVVFARQFIEDHWHATYQIFICSSNSGKRRPIRSWFKSAV